MNGCEVCPQMERLFRQMHQNGAISSLHIYDLHEYPEFAQQFNIRSVPFYLINGVAFNGLKSRSEIDRLLKKIDSATWLELIKQALSSGQLDAVEENIRQQIDARDAMIDLLNDSETALVVRIGLTAIIESLADGDLLNAYENKFIDMVSHEDEQIAIDGMYYLSLLATTASLKMLTDISQNGPVMLRDQARELLEESTRDQVLH